MKIYTKSVFYYFLSALFVLLLSCKDTNQVEFDKLNASSGWNLQLSDPCTGNWQDNWFMDGKLAKVENSEQGMNFIAGPVNRDDAHHAVLWTKKTFNGDVKMEYNYTRTDSQIVNVNILYIQATGIGKDPYDKDISKWNELREIPTMSKYYYNMNALHISYAAFEMVNDDPGADYIRIRKYPAIEGKFAETEIPPSFDKTGLFLPGATYKITVIKTNSKLYFNVEGKSGNKLFSWDLNNMQSIIDGRIGLRHMYTRSARYSNIKVFVK